jgi:hypothetical protein
MAGFAQVSPQQRSGGHAKGLGRPTGAGESPVAEATTGLLAIVPEYHGARETLWEAGGTTLQGAHTPGHR